jgi:hypothetical protein
VALVADAIVNRLVPDADTAVAALVDAGFGFLMMPPHDFQLPSTSASIEYIIDDAVDYRRHEYEVIVVSVASLPQRGVWADTIAAELERRGEAAFPELDLAAVDAQSLRLRVR